MSATLFTAWVPGAPRGKGSVRVGKFGAFKDAKTENYMAVATLAFRAARQGRPTIEAATEVRILAYLPRPASLVPKTGPRVWSPQPPADAFPAPVKPDADNLAKSILDSLVQAGVIADDCRVVELRVVKLYAAIGGDVGVQVDIMGVDDAWSTR